MARVRRLPVPAVPSELESLRKHQKTRELAFAKHLHTSYAGLLDFHYWYCTLVRTNNSLQQLWRITRSAAHALLCSASSYLSVLLYAGSQ